MSLLKRTEKNPAPSTMTIIDKAKKTLVEIEEGVEAGNARARERILKFSKERDELRKQHDGFGDRIAGMTTEYSTILVATMAEEAAAIAATSVVKEDLTAGRVSVSEFLAVGKKQTDIEREARAAALEKLSKVRDAVRVLRLQQYQLALSIATVQEKISSQFSEVAGNFWHRLDSLKRALEAQGISAAGVALSHFRTREAQNDLSLTKGSIVYSGKQWTIQSADQIRLLILDPIVKIEHGPELEKLALQLEHQAYPIFINYQPCESGGRGPGFWFFLGPKSYEVKK